MTQQLYVRCAPPACALLLPLPRRARQPARRTYTPTPLSCHAHATFNADVRLRHEGLDIQERGAAMVLALRRHRQERHTYEGGYGKKAAAASIRHGIGAPGEQRRRNGGARKRGRASQPKIIRQPMPMRVRCLRHAKAHARAATLLHKTMKINARRCYGWHKKYAAARWYVKAGWQERAAMPTVKRHKSANIRLMRRYAVRQQRARHIVLPPSRHKYECCQEANSATRQRRRRCRACRGAPPPPVATPVRHAACGARARANIRYLPYARVRASSSSRAATRHAPLSLLPCCCRY